MRLAGKGQRRFAAVGPDRLVVLYSTHRPEFPWEKIEGGKSWHNTPAVFVVSKPINSRFDLTIIESRSYHAQQVDRCRCQSRRSGQEISDGICRVAAQLLLPELFTHCFCQRIPRHR